MLSKRHNHTDDHHLLENFYNDHDNEWLGILLPRYTVLLLGVCMKYLKNEEDAKDSVQQIFLKVIAELHKYKVDYFKSWIYMVAKNYCLMKLRDKGKYTVEITGDIKANEEDTEQFVSLKEKDATLNEMEKAILKLNKEQQQCVTLFYFERKSYVEIANETGFNLMQVKSYIQNGKRNLKAMLSK